MKTLQNINKLPDGTRIKFETYIWSEMFSQYKVQWRQSVFFTEPNKRKWKTAVKDIHYTDEDLKYQRSEFCDLLKTEVINGKDN